MGADLDTLATALYVRIDDALKMHPELGRPRPEIGLCPKLSDAELLTLAVIQALLGFSSETRFLRHASAHLRHLFPYLPGQSGYNSGSGVAPTNCAPSSACLRSRRRDGSTTPGSSAPPRSSAAGPNRPPIRSDLVGYAGYGYCASHSGYFWGLRLHLVCTPAGLPVAFALANPKDDEREVLRDLLEREASLLGQRPGQVIVADKGYRSKEFEAFLGDHHATLIRPAMAGEAPRPGARFLKPLRQIIESVNDTLKGQLDLERHGGRTWGGVVTRVLQRLLALTAVIWHNGQLGKRPVRSLLAYDH